MHRKLPFAFFAVVCIGLTTLSLFAGDSGKSCVTLDSICDGLPNGDRNTSCMRHNGDSQACDGGASPATGADCNGDGDPGETCTFSDDLTNKCKGTDDQACGKKETYDCEYSFGNPGLCLRKGNTTATTDEDCSVKMCVNQ